LGRSWKKGGRGGRNRGKFLWEEENKQVRKNEVFFRKGWWERTEGEEFGFRRRGMGGAGEEGFGGGEGRCIISV